METKMPRDYISRLRSDPRLHAMMQGWVSQATMEAESRYPGLYDDRQRAHWAAETAIRLAMSFVLDNDGAYQMLREEMDRVLKNTLELVNSTPLKVVIERSSPPDQP